MKEIPLTQGMVALVDDDDFDLVSQYKWCARKCRHTYYAVRWIKRPDGTGTQTQLHRAILKTDKSIDHINRNGLDNRRVNLRPATHSQNQANRLQSIKNRSGYKGVHEGAGKNKWQAEICFQNKRFTLGTHMTPEDAARAYDAKARELFGEYARCNFE